MSVVAEAEKNYFFEVPCHCTDQSAKNAICK